MLPDDPRHGTNAGYIAGCRCEGCTEATWRYHKHLMVDHANGRRRLVSALGTRRRIEALMALGWSGQLIAEALGGGIDWDEVRQYRTRAQVKRSTHERVAAVYDRLSMTLPVGRTRYERQTISRTRNYARRMGWAPPLAYDNIDDPAEQPVVVRICADPGCAREVRWRGLCLPHYKADLRERTEAKRAAS